MPSRAADFKSAASADSAKGPRTLQLCGYEGAGNGALSGALLNSIETEEKQGHGKPISRCMAV